MATFHEARNYLMSVAAAAAKTACDEHANPDPFDAKTAGFMLRSVVEEATQDAIKAAQHEAAHPRKADNPATDTLGNSTRTRSRRPKAAASA